MDLPNLIREIHSLVRWVVVVVSLIALIWFALVWIRGVRNEKADRGLMAAFSGLIDIQVLIGIILTLWLGFAGAGFPPYRIEHAAVMVIAAALSHLSVRWRTLGVRLRGRNNLALIVGVLFIIFIGVSLLPQGWLG